jgi:hypothetical protein
MPLFRRKNASVPPPDPHPQQQWVAYMYAPQSVQPVPVHPMYALRAAPFAPQYAHMGLPPAYRTIVNGAPVQYIYHQKSSSSYSDSPHHATNPLPIPPHVRSTVETDYHHLSRRLRSYSGSQPATAPISQGGEAERYPFPYVDDGLEQCEVEVRTQPKHGVFTTLVNFARGRSKSRGRNEAEPTGRPRSRGGFVDEKRSYDGHDRERGRAKDPRYVDGDRERRLSNEKELKKVKHESQRNFEKTMIETLENNLRQEPMQQEDRYRVPTNMVRSSTKEDLKRRYEAEDRLRQQQEAATEYERSQPVQVPNMRPSSRNPAASPDGLSESPTLVEHTQWNARQLGSGNGRPGLRHRPDSGYHTDAPTKSRRTSMPLHVQMQRLDSPTEKSAPALKAPEGFFNQRGDQLMNSKGDILRRPPHLEYPPEFATYPPPGIGWQDHKGQVSYLLMISSTLLICFIACRTGPQMDQESGLVG